MNEGPPYLPHLTGHGGGLHDIRMYAVHTGGTGWREGGGRFDHCLQGWERFRVRAMDGRTDG